MIMCFLDLVKLCPVILKILSKNYILTSIKGCNSVANLKKKKTSNAHNINENVHKKFGLILSIRSQDIEQKSNSDVNQGPLLSRLTIPT